MATDYKTPGVYIEEISTLPASVAAVATAIPAFVGHTRNTSYKGESLLNKPTRITSLLDFEEKFGKPQNEAFELTVEDTYTEDPPVFVSRSFSAKLDDPSAYKLYYHLQMFFNNGGSTCYIVSVGDFGSAPSAGDDTSGLSGGLKSLEKADEPTLLVFPDYMALADYKAVYDAALAHCEKLKDRFVIMDVKDETANAVTDAGEFRNNGIGSGNLKYGAVYYPSINTTLNYYYETDLTVSQVITYDGGGTAPTPTFNNDTLETIRLSEPSVYRQLLAEIAKKRVELTPVGAMAGIYARVDRERGVWKAPANVGVRSIVGPTRKITNADQDILNVDATSGKSINAIRNFTGKGTLVWGSRTLAGNDNEWRYVPVRRLYIFVEESLKKATEFVVFEPNDANTWLRLRTMTENFLTSIWRAGGLAGATTEDAFFVNVGLGQTMSSIDILEGRLNVEIGLAAVRPAEFIILKFSHKLQES